MDNFVKSLIDEHKNLVIKLDAVRSDYYDNIDDLPTHEVINIAIQLRGMEMYEEALFNRLKNFNIEFNGRDYYEKVDSDTDTDNNDKEDECSD